MSDLPNNKLNLGPHPQYPKSVKPGIPRLSQPKPGWKTYRIGELFEVINRPVSMDDETTYQLVTVKRARGGVCEREKLKGKQISVKSQFYVNSGDFLVSKRQIVHGACGFVPEALDGAIVSNEYAVLHCKDKLLPSFLNYIIHTPYFQQTCFHSSIGVHVEKMIFKLEDWFRMKINIPSLQEQASIADYLDNVGKKQACLIAKLSLLEKYKFNLARNIFLRKLNFKETVCTGCSDWEEKTLGQLGSFIGGGTPSTEIPEFWQGKIPWISSSDLTDGDITEVSISRFISETAIKHSATKLVPANSILIVSRVGLGKLAITNQAVCTSQDFSNFIPENCNPIFIAYLLRFNRNKFLSLAQGTSIKGFTNGDLANLKLMVPCLAEQKKIARLLSVYDQKINAIKQQIKKLESFKQGLLLHIFE